MGAAALRSGEHAETEGEEPPAEARLEAALEALRELEFEYGTGKLPEEEYRRLRRKYGRLALEARGELEGAGPAAAERAAVERAAATEAPEPAPPAGPPDGPPSVCTSCGATLGPEDRFCSHCGARRA